MSKLYINPLYLDETNGNTLVNSPTNEIVLHSPSSNDELSLSEYTDAESISAPTELFAEFLSAIMAKDYRNALRYCQLILQYEPNNTTAKDFYPHLMNKINEMTENANAIENYNIPSSSSNSDDMDDEVMVCSSISDQSSSGSSSYLNYSNCESDSDLEDDGRMNMPNLENFSQSSYSNSNNQPSNNNTSHSYSSILLEEEERELSLSDISNLNIDDEDFPDSSAKSNTISSGSTSSRHEEFANGIITINSPTREPFAHKIMTIIRSKCISSIPKSHH